MSERALFRAVVVSANGATREVTLRVEERIGPPHDDAASVPDELRGTYVVGLPCDPAAASQVAAGDEVLAAYAADADPTLWLTPWADPIVLGPELSIATDELADLQNPSTCMSLHPGQPDADCDDTRESTGCSLREPGDAAARGTWGAAAWFALMLVRFRRVRVGTRRRP